METEPKLCACGCGKPIVPKRNHRWVPATFLPGHHSKGNTHRRYTPTPDEIPSGLCECGCGQSTGIAKATLRSRRWFRGHPMPFVAHHTLQRRGADSPKWKGGRRVDRHGYVLIHAPAHPAAVQGYVLEHRLVMEQVLGRPLERGEVVHHINHVKTDNRAENLMLLTHGAHSTLHAPERRYSSETMSAAGKKGAAARWAKPD